MCSINHLILTANSFEDAQRWGFYSNGILVTIDNSGACLQYIDLHDLPKKDQCRIAILNMAGVDAYPYNEPGLLEILFERLVTMLGVSPRLWVHLGGVNSNDLNSTSLLQLTNWGKADYAYFRKIFTELHPTCGPIPYSQTSSTKWDSSLKEGTGLTSAVKSALDSGAPIDVNYWCPLLESAWELARQFFSPQSLKKARDKMPMRDALRALLPLAIAADGLDFAVKRSASGKIRPMKALFAKQLSVIPDDVLAPLDLAGQRVMLELRAGRIEDDTFTRKASEFLTWYRGCAEQYVPDAQPPKE